MHILLCDYQPPKCFYLSRKLHNHVRTCSGAVCASQASGKRHTTAGSLSKRIEARLAQAAFEQTLFSDAASTLHHWRMWRTRNFKSRVLFARRWGVSEISRRGMMEVSPMRTAIRRCRCSFACSLSRAVGVVPSRSVLLQNERQALRYAHVSPLQQARGIL